MAQKVSNSSNWMAQFNYDSSQEFYRSYEINSVIDGNTDIDGNWGTDDTYMEHDLGDTLQETKGYGKINAKVPRIVGKTMIGASAVLITAALVMEVMSGYKPTLAGLYSVDGQASICQVSQAETGTILSYSFEVTYKVASTLYVHIEAGEATSDKTYSLAATQNEEVTFSMGTYLTRIDNEDEPFLFPEAYEGLYSLSVSANYGFGITSLSSIYGRV